MSTEDQPEDQPSLNPSSLDLRATTPGPKLKPVKPKSMKPKKKRKDNQRRERKATQTLAIVLGKYFSTRQLDKIANTKKKIIKINIYIFFF